MPRFTRPIALMTLLLASCTPGTALGQGSEGQQDAIDEALRQAAVDCVQQMLANLPPEVEQIAVLPFLNDPDGAAAAAVEHELVQRKATMGIRVVTRSDADWMRLTEEWVFTEDQFDVIPEELLPNLQQVLPAGAVAWGKLNSLGLDDSRIKGQADLQTRLGAVASGELVGSGMARTTVTIDPETFVLAWIHKPIFWVIAGAAVVVLVLLLLMLPFVLRLLAQGSKPRTIIR